MPPPITASSTFIFYLLTFHFYFCIYAEFLIIPKPFFDEKYLNEKTLPLPVPITVFDFYGEIFMAKRSGKTQKSQPNVSELVVVTFVQDIDQAKEYEILLQNNDIPAVLKKQKEQSGDNEGIAVMVPEECLDEAHVIIESQGAYDDFYDFALEGEEDDRSEYDDDMLDDNF